MKSILAWLSGKKTYLLAFLLIVVCVVLIWLGKLTPTTASGVFLVFVALFAASFRSALGAHQLQLAALFAGSAATLRDIAAKNFKAAAADGATVAVEAQQLTAEVQAEKAAAK